MIDGKPRIGDEVYIHGYIDEIRNDVVIIRNEGGYFGTSDREIFYYEEDERGYGTMNEADRKTENSSEKPNNCDTCRNKGFEGCEQPCLGCGCCGLYEPKTEPTTQAETQNSNLTFEKRTMRDCYNCKRYETEDECIECHYEPKDEPQTVLEAVLNKQTDEDRRKMAESVRKAIKDEPKTCSVNGRPYSECSSCEHFKCTVDEPQTDAYDYKGNGKWERSE